MFDFNRKSLPNKLDHGPPLPQSFRQKITFLRNELDFTFLPHLQ